MPLRPVTQSESRLERSDGPVRGRVDTCGDRPPRLTPARPAPASQERGSKGGRERA